MVSRRLLSLALATTLPLALSGCGSKWWSMDKPAEKPNLVAPPPSGPVAPEPFPSSGSGGSGAAGAPAVVDNDDPAHVKGIKPIPEYHGPVTPAPPEMVHAPEAPLEEPTTLPPSEAAIPINIVGSWVDDRGASLTFTDDGRFEIDAKSPEGSTVRAMGNYALIGNRATLTYAGVDIDTSDPKMVQNMDQIKEEFMKKGPGATPQIEAIEMKSRNAFVMRLKNPGANPTVAILKRKA